MPTDLTTPANDQDREFFDRELESFLPDRIFDAHAHLMKEGTHKFKSRASRRRPATTPTSSTCRTSTPAGTRLRCSCRAFSADLKDKLPEANAWMGEQTAKGRTASGRFSSARKTIRSGCGRKFAGSSCTD